MWVRGKQHGLGMYTVPGSDTKCGLWEDGKRIEWFDATQAQQVLQGKIDFTKFFHKPESAHYADLNAGFQRPAGFD